MSFCVKCGKEAEFDTPEFLCKDHWADWWASGLSDDPKERELLKKDLNQEWYIPVDPQLMKLIQLLNQVNGIKTIDSCFGHTEEMDRQCNHHTNSFIGMTYTDKAAFDKFWIKFFNRFVGKVDIVTTLLGTDAESWVQFVLEKSYVKDFCNNLIRFNILPCHNPATEKGIRDKLAGIKLAEEFTEQYLKDQKIDPRVKIEARIKELEGEMKIDNLMQDFNGGEIAGLKFALSLLKS